MNKVSAIICVFNEEKTLRNVILSVAQNQYIDEVIIVNDGSSDNSKNIIDELYGQLSIKPIHLTQNMGKGFAMAIGVENAENEIIFFIDADQTKIAPNYIKEMLSIFLEEGSDMLLGYSTVKVGIFNVNPLKILTGERIVYKKNIVQILKKITTVREKYRLK